MSPLDSRVFPAPQNHNLDIEPESGNGSEQIMSFAGLGGDVDSDPTGPSFLDSAFYETFAGLSLLSLIDAEGAENVDKANGTGVPSESVLLGDLSSSFSDQTQTAAKQRAGQPRTLHSRHRDDTTQAFMPSPSSWSSMSSMLLMRTSPNSILFLFTLALRVPCHAMR